MVMEGGAYRRQCTANFSMDMEVGGDVRLSFTDGSFVDVPIGAILQAYLPDVFRGQGAVAEKPLLFRMICC